MSARLGAMLLAAFSRRPGARSGRLDEVRATGGGPVGSPALDAPLDRLDFAAALLLALVAYRLYRVTAPAEVNLDGLGYLKLLPHNFSAGHLLYMPLLRAVTALFHGDALLAGRRLDASCAALSVALAHVTARAFGGRVPSLLAAAGLGLSYGLWVQGSDVECYAPALLALLLLWALLLAFRVLPTLETALALGVALGVAVLSHLTHVLAVPLVVTWVVTHGGSRRRGAALAAVTAGTGMAIACACYAYAGFAVRYTDGAGLLRWIATAQHGFRYQGTLLSRVADSAYGLSRAVVWSPYLYESNAQRLLAQFLVGLAVVSALIGTVVVQARKGKLARLPLAALLVWAGPYAAMALAFFGSDHERWLFVLPPLWTGAGAALATSRRGVAVGVALVAVVAAANYESAIAPAIDWTWDRTRADAAAEPMRDGDLVIFPGHSWDEYIGFHTGRQLVPLPVAYYAGVAGRAACMRRIEGDIRSTWRRGATVWAVRLLDDISDERGFYELAQLGIERGDLRALLAGFRLTAVATSQPAVTVYRLDPR